MVKSPCFSTPKRVIFSQHVSIIDLYLSGLGVDFSVTTMLPAMNTTFSQDETDTTTESQIHNTSASFTNTTMEQPRPNLETTPKGMFCLNMMNNY